MNRRQWKKKERKGYSPFPYGRLKNGRWVKKKARLLEKEYLELGIIELAKR